MKFGDLGRTIYLDNHASTPLDPRVMEAMAPFFRDRFGNPHATDHADGWRAYEGVATATHRISTAMGVDSDEIIFTSGATEANNLAILGMARRASPARRRILVSAVEHTSVLSTALATQPLGFTVEQLPVDSNGLIDINFLDSRLGPDVLLVSVVAVNNEIGTIQPIGEVVRAAHSVGAYAHTDATQAFTAGIPDIASWDVDMLTFSGHKIYGPKGIGALFVRREIQADIEPLMYGGDQQSGIRPGTMPVPLCVGLGEAVALVASGDIQAEKEHIQSLRDRLIVGVQCIDSGICLNGPPSKHRHPGNASLRFSGYDAQEILAVIQPHIAASAGSACSSGIIKPSHVLRAIGLSETEANSSVRFCVGRFTTQSDIDESIILIKDALRRLSEWSLRKALEQD